LFELLRIPSISAQSDHQKDMVKAAAWIHKKLTSLGLKSNILSTKGHPVVYAELMANSKWPTILVYGHYDVQDHGNPGEWSSNPFEPEIRNGNIYGRGVADDKGQLYTWIAALSDLRASRFKLRTNIKFLIEGEEEIGSRNLEEFVDKNKSLLASDICLVSDSDCISENDPVITYGLRGIIYFEISIKTLPKDVHSGTYGGNVLNPIEVLSNLLSGLKNNERKILIPNFYKNLRKIPIQEKRRLNHYPFGEREIKKETGAKVVVGEKGYTIQERAGARPALDINGIWGGYQGEGAKTIIPQKAQAKFSMRIVPLQNPKDIIKNTKNYFLKNTPKGAEFHLKVLAADSAVLVNTTNKYFGLAEKAYKKVFGKKPHYHLHGATIPVGGMLKRALNIDTVYMGYGLPDDGLHGPNEKFSLGMFEKGIQTNSEFLKSL